MTLRIPDPLLGPWSKSVPARLHGMPLSAVVSADVRLSEFDTPVMTVHEAALAHNEATVLRWVAEQGLQLAPHGKTTMAPALWQRLIDAGSWGITVATPWQASVAIDAGVERVLLANAVAHVGAAGRLGRQLVERPGLRVLVWADSTRTVGILTEGLTGSLAELDVLVELGGVHGRTGARTIKEGEEIARAVVAAPGLRLAGVAGYEGPFGPDRSAASVSRVDGYLGRLGELFNRILPLAAPGLPLILTAGGGGGGEAPGPTGSLRSWPPSPIAQRSCCVPVLSRSTTTASTRA